MKKNDFKLFMLFAIYIAMTLTGCDKSDENVGTTYYSELYADSLFLEIKGDIREPEVIWGNVDTYMQAFKRMERHLSSKDGFITWDFSKASELKISDNIYDYVIEFIESKNDKLKENISRAAFSDTTSRPHFFDDIEYVKILKKGEHDVNSAFLLICISNLKERAIIQILYMSIWMIVLL